MGDCLEFLCISMFVFYYLMVPFLGCLGRDWKKSLVVALSINSVSIVILKCMKIIFAGEFGGNLDFIERSFLRMLPIFLLGTAALSAKRRKGNFLLRWHYMFFCYICLESGMIISFSVHW